MISVAIIYAVIAMLGFGIANPALKGVISSFGPLRAIVLRNTIASIVLGLALIIMAEPIRLTPLFGWAVVLAIVSYLPFLFFVRGLEKGKVGIVIPVASARVIVSAVFSFLVLGESFTVLKALAVLIIFGGVALLSVNFRDFKNSHLFTWSSGVPFAVLAALLWGVIYPLFKFPSLAFGALFYSFVIELTMLIAASTHLLLQKQSPIPPIRDLPHVRALLPAILAAGVATGVGTAFTNLGYLTGAVSIVTAISGSSIVVSLIGAGLFFKERLTLQQYAGAFAVFVGIVVAAFG